MLTRAAEQVLQTFFVQNGQSGTSSVVRIFPNEPIKDTSGNDRYLSYISTYYLWQPYAYINTLTNTGIRVGRGLTTPTKYDYYMENPINSDMTLTVTGTSRGTNNGVPYVQFILVCTNTASSNVTISEIGYVNDDLYGFESPSSTSIRYMACLLDRTLLDNPVTIEPSQSASIKYTISCDMSFA